MTDELPPRCARCVHFHMTGTRDARGAASGECRALPPRFDPLSGRDAAWPRLRSDNWCSTFLERRRAA